MEKDRARRILRLPPDQPLLLQLGRMVPRKGVETAIRSIAELARHHAIRARLLVVGGETSEGCSIETPEIGRLRAIADAAGVAEQVFFTGSRTRAVLRNYYSAADLFITTPWYEPFGITPLEAMACARPVIASRVGGLKSTVVDGHTGFLVEPRDAETVADRAAQLLRDPRRLRAFGDAGWRRAHLYYTWPKIAARVAALYDRVQRNTSQPVVQWEEQRLTAS